MSRVRIATTAFTVHRLVPNSGRGRFPVALVAAVALAVGGLAAAGCSESDPPTVGQSDDAVTLAQCTFFAVGDRVQICHRTSSARNPYNIIRTSAASCGGHSGHAGDYITSTDPASPIYDPTCNGQGCLPEGAPSDPSIECCTGLAPVGGTCRNVDECLAPNNGGCGSGSTCSDNPTVGAAPICTDINECATNNGGCGTGASCTNAPLSGQAPICTDINECATNNGGCGTGASCTNAPLSGQAPTCTDINECATNNGGCATGYSCTNAPVSGDPAICTPPPAVCGDHHVDAGEQCDDGNSVNGDGCSATCMLEGCPSASAPSHQWTFNDGTAHDSVGGATGTLFGTASIAGGALVLDNLLTAPNQHLTGQYMKAALPDAVSTKTLVVWASLANLTQHGGSALTIENRIIDGTGSNHFDAVDYAEQVAGQWMAGSDNFNRTKGGSNGGAAETSANAVMLAIVYGTDNSITIYRDGALYMNPVSYMQGVLLSYLGGASDAVIGLRHSQCNTNCWLSGTIDEARIYPVALTACQIQALQPVPQPAPACPAGASPFGSHCYVAVRNVPLNPDDAEAACVATYAGHLASVHSAAEDQFLSQLVDPAGVGGDAGGRTAWIGGISGPSGFCAGATGTYAWTDGSPWDYNNWRPNSGYNAEPNGCGAGRGCIQLWPTNNANRALGCGGINGCSGWNDVGCTVGPNTYVCEFAQH